MSPLSAAVRAPRQAGHDALRRARQIAWAVGDFEARLLGRLPRSIAISSGASSVVITIHTALSGMERQLVMSASGYDRVVAWHRSLVESSFEALRDHVRAHSGVVVGAVATHIDTATGSLFKTCTTEAAIDLIVLGGHPAAFGVAVDDHFHVDGADGHGSVRRGYYPKGLTAMKKVTYVGTDQEESRKCGDRSAS